MRLHSALHGPEIVFLSCVLSACATSPIDTEKARPGELANAAASYAAPTDKSGTLIVKRDSGMMGAACKSRIYLDGQMVGAIGSGEKITLYVPAGEHIIGARPNAPCGGGAAENQFAIGIGAVKTYRVSSGQAGDYSIQPTAF